MKKLIALMLAASFTGAIIAQQAAPQQTVPAKTTQTAPAATNKTAPADKKDKKKHHGHHHHHPKPGEATK